MPTSSTGRFLMEEIYWGHELILDIYNVDVNQITDSNTIYRFVKQLVKDIDMIAYGEPQIVNFGSGNKAGYTLSQLIETSNIVVHFVPDDGTGGSAMYFNCFSCKTFDEDVVIKLISKYFGKRGEEIVISKKLFIDRQASPDQKNIVNNVFINNPVGGLI
jgi:S-adenosylmethionine/arginine decarboxylase-like enzyme